MHKHTCKTLNVYNLTSNSDDELFIRKARDRIEVSVTKRSVKRFSYLRIVILMYKQQTKHMN